MRSEVVLEAGKEQKLGGVMQFEQEGKEYTFSSNV